MPRRKKKRYGDYSDNEPQYDRRFAEEETRTFGPEPADGDREQWSSWSTCPPGDRGPAPYPDWLVTDAGATDTDLGVLKTGKEADVFLIRRAAPGGDPAVLLAAKRYRSAEHRMFRRDAAYLEGRKVRESREMRAMATGTAYGNRVIDLQWSRTEFAALSALHQHGLPVPYPVQITGTEIVMEFVGDDDGKPAPRLADADLDGSELAAIWVELVDVLVAMARLGYTHGDLSPYNILIHFGSVVLIDLPQLVDVSAGPRGLEFLDRDARNISRWFTAQGLSHPAAEPGELGEILRREAG